MSKQTVLNVLVARPNVPVEMVEIEDSLEAMQAVVEGPIEVVKPWSADVALICNEEGCVKKLPANRIVFKSDGEPFGCIYGTFFLCLAPRNSERFLSLPRMVASRYAPFMVPVLHLE